MKAGRIGILGGGISGVALAAHLGAGEKVELLEAADRLGGLCSTVQEAGFTFDAAGPHIMFSKNKDVLTRMVWVLGANVHQRRRENRIWFKGRLVKYPFENDLASLPKQDNFECLIGYLQNPHRFEPKNLAEWSYVTFGEGISEKYFIPYNRKIWNFDPSRLSLEFVARIPKPPVEDVVKSAIGIPTEGYLHQLYFSYPVEGGYESIVHAFAALAPHPLRTGWRVVHLERTGATWRVRSASGEEREYDTLVSTIPIHELMKIWPAAPPEARRAVEELRYNSLINVLLGSDEAREDPFTALYIPDPEVVFHRLSYPKNFSEHTVPAGKSSLMAEITANAGDGVWELSDQEVLARVVADLAAMGLCEPAKISYSRVVRFLYGYPVYDLDYRRNVTALRESIASTGLHLLGRFAQFDYINSDVCIERALGKAAELAGE